MECGHQVQDSAGWADEWKAFLHLASTIGSKSISMCKSLNKIVSYTLADSHLCMGDHYALIRGWRIKRDTFTDKEVIKVAPRSNGKT